MRRRWARWFALAALMAAGSAGSASASEFYYVLVFGSQTHPKQLRYSHTWATFVRAVGDGPHSDAYAVEAHTISWVPSKLTVDVWSPRPDSGRNLDLESTFAMTDSHNENVTMWGPFQVGPEVYARSLQESQRLAGGQIRYRAIDGSRDLLVSDCIHAVAAVDPQFGRSHYPLIRIGNSASRYIARQIVDRGAYDHTTNDHAWLIPRLGLDRHDLTVVPPSSLKPNAMSRLLR